MLDAEQVGRGGSKPCFIVGVRIFAGLEMVVCLWLKKKKGKEKETYVSP